MLGGGKEENEVLDRHRLARRLAGREARGDRRRRLRRRRDLRGGRAGARGLAAPRSARMVRDHGLEIVAFQPFRDFEGMPEPQRARGFERAKRKFELMNELGAGAILVCSNVSPACARRHRPGGGGPARARRDRRGLRHRRRLRGAGLGPARLRLPRRLGDRAPGRPSARSGVILDSWHVLARGLPVDPIRAIPADRITFVQLADAPRMDMDLLQWSRHFRNFPGQGDLPVDDFMAAVVATGYDGWLSLEIFNDRFRMASPRRIAEDGERSLIWLGDRMRPGRMPPRGGAGGGGVDRVRRVRGRRGGARRGSSTGSGFRLTGRHRSKQVTRWTPGRDQPRHQHRARGARALAPDRARAVGGGDRAPGRRRRGGAGAGRGAADRRPSASRWGRASSTSRRSAGSAGSLIYFTDAARDLGAGLGDRVRAGRARRRPGRSPASTTSRSR